MTVAFWFKTKTTQSGARFFEFSGKTGDGNNFLQTPYNGPYNGLMVFTETAGVFKNPMTFTDNVWYHSAWTLTYAASKSKTSTWKYYVNGELKQTYTDGYYVPTVLNNNWIGKSNWSGDPYYNGAIDDFRLYDKVLTESEIKSLYTIV
jgi:hypothetical protein